MEKEKDASAGAEIFVVLSKEWFQFLDKLSSSERGVGRAASWATFQLHAPDGAQALQRRDLLGRVPPQASPLDRSDPAA